MLRGRLFVDLVNRNYNRDTDQLPAAPEQVLTIQLPTWLQGLELSARTAANRGQAGIVVNGAEANIHVNGVADIVTVIVESNF
jgi:hypothetical protein